ncbi:LPS-assembly protein [Humidesulfovibrio mexicanus]|uniref:LPS-assembly protein n=1 Tax=Humidesulfovibrio mexicanus TaxID=147047 RepID=A0A239B012_9BACT|nr:LPS assembly protein LptD [Humidesulfovibrio mexicanus]SNS00614.1 LPS-assembly protein [Humidesulfovibrio mexicanus]
MKRKRLVTFLALGLFFCPLAGLAQTPSEDSASGGNEVRLPVTAPPPPKASGTTRQVRLELPVTASPAAPAPLKAVEIPTANQPALPVFDEKQLLQQIAAPPQPPSFPGVNSNGPELRLGVTPPQAAGAGGAAPARGAAAVGGEQPWSLAADRIIGQHGSEYLEALGSATLVRGFNSLRADSIRYYNASRWVVLRGNVRVLWEGDVLEAQEAEFDLSNMQGWLKHGKIFVAKSNVHVETAYAKKYATSSYRFQNAKFTACDGEKPAWSFTAEEGDLDLTGRTRLWGTRFNVLDQPVLYSPYLLLPGSGKRQSGLLIPDISRSSQRGYTINQPYYHVIDEERDLTFYEYYMTKHGLMQGLEYRHSENSRTKGDWRIDYLHDSKVAANQHQEELYQQSDGLLRPNRNRWWLRSKYDGFVAEPEWALKIDLDMVSDQNYLREFNPGASGYESSRKNFLKDFGRDIEVSDSLTRTSTAFLSRSWDAFGVTAKVAWVQNLAYMNGNNSSSRNPTTQSLPEINAFAFKNAIPGTPLDFEAAGRFNYFWREFGTRGIRTDIHPTVSLPLNWGPVTLVPSAGLRNTAYTVGGYTNEPSSTTTNKTPARTMYELGFTGFTEFSRVFKLDAAPLSASAENIGKTQWGALRHSVMPRLEFAYVPAPKSQERLPYFDSLDRITRQNKITYSVTNVLDRKRTSVVAAPGPAGSNTAVPVVSTDYLDFLSLRLEQSFDRDEAARTEDLARYPKRPFSDIMLQADVRPEKFVTLSSRTYYSPYLKRPTEHEHLLTLHKDDLGELRFGHDYLYPISEYTRTRTSDVQVLRIGADYKITDKLKVTSDYRLDIAAHSDLEKSAGLVWTDQCYEVQLKYSRKPSDQSIELRFNLLDFGKP